MKQTFEGQCQCGAVQYTVLGRAVTLFACHCTECQRQSSSAFGMALWINEAEVEITGSDLKEWVRTMPSGAQMACRFCALCGTRLFHQVLGQSQILSIKPGTLKDTTSLQPVGHIWMDSKQPWVHVEASALQYAGNPESFDGLRAAWHDSHV